MGGWIFNLIALFCTWTLNTTNFHRVVMATGAILTRSQRARLWNWFNKHTNYSFFHDFNVVKTVKSTSTDLVLFSSTRVIFQRRTRCCSRQLFILVIFYFITFSDNLDLIFKTYPCCCWWNDKTKSNCIRCEADLLYGRTKLWDIQNNNLQKKLKF